MNTSPEIADLAAALASAQGEMAHAAKDRSNPAFKSRYADLASIVDACREPLSRHGIAVLQPPTVALSENGVLVSVETRFIHKSGQWASTTLSSWVPDAKAQSIGSAITYLRRYGLSAMAGVAPEDDDGNAASRPPRDERPAPQPANTPPKRDRGPDEQRYITRARNLLTGLQRDDATTFEKGLALLREYSPQTGKIDDVAGSDLGPFVSELEALINLGAQAA